jgi:hypothetical protein
LVRPRAYNFVLFRTNVLVKDFVPREERSGADPLRLLSSSGRRPAVRSDWRHLDHADRGGPAPGASLLSRRRTVGHAGRAHAQCHEIRSRHSRYCKRRVALAGGLGRVNGRCRRRPVRRDRSCPGRSSLQARVVARRRCSFCLNAAVTNAAPFRVRARASVPATLRQALGCAEGDLHLSHPAHREGVQLDLTSTSS